MDLQTLIQQEARWLYPDISMVKNPGDKRNAFKEGCNFMIKHMEGLLEWVKGLSWMRTDTGETLYDLEDGKGYVVSPSQLVTKYFETI